MHISVDIFGYLKLKKQNSYKPINMLGTMRTNKKKTKMALVKKQFTMIHRKNIFVSIFTITFAPMSPFS